MLGWEGTCILCGSIRRVNACSWLYICVYSVRTSSLQKYFRNADASRAHSYSLYFFISQHTSFSTARFFLWLALYIPKPMYIWIFAYSYTVSIRRDGMSGRKRGGEGVRKRVEKVWVRKREGECDVWEKGEGAAHIANSLSVIRTLFSYSTPYLTLLKIGRLRGLPSLLSSLSLSFPLSPSLRLFSPSLFFKNARHACMAYP